MRNGRKGEAFASSEVGKRVVGEGLAPPERKIGLKRYGKITARGNISPVRFFVKKKKYFKNKCSLCL